MELWGLAPRESPWREVARLPGARLRAYLGAGGAGPVLLILPAPFKHAYIWDLAPPVSVVRAALERDARVFLLEWLPPTGEVLDFGLRDYALRLPQAAVEAIAAETGERRVALMGHSLGGTFAAIFAALRPHLVNRLGLIDAPLSFGASGGPIAQAVAEAPHARRITMAVGNPVADTAINLFSVAAMPEAFVLQRWVDLLASPPSPEALMLHLRVMRWTLDEMPCPTGSSSTWRRSSTGGIVFAAAGSPSDPRSRASIG